MSLDLEYNLNSKLISTQGAQHPQYRRHRCVYGGRPCFPLIGVCETKLLQPSYFHLLIQKLGLDGS